MPDWHHAPLHRFDEAGTYIVTAGTHLKQPVFDTPAALDLLLATFFEVIEKHGWLPQAWAFFPNHYHFVATSSSPATLQRLVRELHSRSAVEINRTGGTPGRKVWFQYWDSQITIESSYYARLKYVHENPVHHRVVERAVDYKWCSASAFEASADSRMLRILRTMKIDRVTVPEFS